MPISGTLVGTAGHTGGPLYNAARRRRGRGQGTWEGSPRRDAVAA